MTEEGTGSAFAARPSAAQATGTGWILVGSVVGGIGAYLFQVIGTRTLGEQAYAPIATLWTVQYLAWSTALFAVETLVVRHTLDLSGGRLRAGAEAARIRSWIVGSAVAVTAACWLGRDRLFFGLGELSLVAGAVVVTYGGFAVTRGRLAGRRRYRAYGILSATESIVRLAAASAIAAGGTSTSAMAWTLPVGAAVSTFFALGVLRRGDPSVGAGRARRRSDRSDAGFLVAATLANAAAQLLLAGGPIAMVILSAPASDLSVFFVTITAARVPLVVALGGVLSRLLPAFADLLDRRGEVALRRASILVAAVTGVLAGVAGIAAAGVGSTVIGAMFGEALEPPGWLAAVAVGGVVLGTGGLVLNQLLIAGRVERWLMPPWFAGVATAVGTLAIVSGETSWRVGIALVAGEIVALVGLVGAAWFASGRATRTG